MSKSARSLVLLAFALAIPRVARANGRFPQSISIHVQPNDDSVILMGLTFGLLVSTDGGAHFRWVCEDALGYTGTFDPAYAIGPDGTFYASSFDGLRTSTNGGCTFPVHPDMTGPIVDDVEIGPDGTVYAAGSWKDTNGTTADGVWRSKDNGKSFTKTTLSSGVYSWWTSVVVASDAQRVYAGGYKIGSFGSSPQDFALLYRSDNGGDSWSPVDLSTVTFTVDPTVEVRAVWPGNPDIFFITIINSSYGETLYRTQDGGTSFSKVLEIQQNSIGTVLIKKDGSQMIVGGVFGEYISTDGGKTFPTHQDTPQLANAVELSNGTLLGLGTNWDPDYMAMGSSTDGKKWTSLFTFDDIVEPLRCPAGTTQHDTCEDKFYTSVCTYAPSIPLCPQSDAGVTDAGIGPDARSGGGGGGKGCCDSGAGESSLVLGLIVLALLRRRRSALQSR